MDLDLRLTTIMRYMLKSHLKRPHYRYTIRLVSQQLSLGQRNRVVLSVSKRE